MSKPFNIHDWHAKQRLAEEDKKETLAISPEEMEQLHKTGKVRLKDGSLLVFAGDLNVKEDELDEMSTTGTGASFQAGSGEAYATPKAFKKKKDINEAYSGFLRNPEDPDSEKFEPTGSVFEFREELRALFGKFKGDLKSPDFIKGVAQIMVNWKSLLRSQLDENKKKKKNINEVSYSDFKRNTESSPRQKIARGISQVSKMIKEIEKIVAHNFKLKTELDMNSGTFLKSTNRKIHELGARLKQLENKLREFSN